MTYVANYYHTFAKMKTGDVSTKRIVKVSFSELYMVVDMSRGARADDEDGGCQHQSNYYLFVMSRALYLSLTISV